MMVLAICAAGGQSPPLRDPSDVHKPPAPLSATDPVVHQGLLSIDVVVADTSGNPVSDLSPGDFTLLDNGQPAKIRTLHNSLAASEPPPELIFVLDAINLSPQQLTEAESSMVRFLRGNNGRRDSRYFLYRLTRNGLFSSLRPVTDGALLAKEVEQERSQWAVWAADRRDNSSLGSWESGLPRNQLSVRALGSIAIHQREIAGRKVVVWIGPGWPVLGSGESDFNEITELSTRLREARITVDNVAGWPNPEAAFDYHRYLEPPRSQKDMQPAKMALQVIATHTGGLVLNAPGDLDRELERCVEAERNFYTLTFNPPHTYTMDEYHDLHVRVARPAITVRAPMGYYNEPVYFDNPRPGIEKVSVAQLEELVHSNTDLARKLENLELTERLSTPRLDALLSLLHSERERQALTADADLSFPLAPPPDEILNRPPPPVEEQRAILRRTFDYLQNALPKLPDFSALRNTVRFEEPPERENEIWKLPHQDQTLHFATGEHATVLYRNGAEVVEKKQKLGKRKVTASRARNLEIQGTFGPILAFVPTAAASDPGALKWKRWERGKDGDLAVYSYAANPKIAPEISYCCLPEGDGTNLYKNRSAAFGEFAVNPDTGAIMRIVISADLDEERDPDVPLIRSEIMVEYGPQEVGGKNYICPLRSVEISRGRSERVLREWNMVFSLYSYFETMINDVTFGGYHKFGSEARILPGFDETLEGNPPASPRKAQPAIEESGGPRPVTVTQLAEVVGRARGAGDSEAAKEIEHLQLTERLSNANLATLTAELPGRKSKATLLMLGDASVFLAPPDREIPQKPAPDTAEQKQILSQAMDYLKKVVPKLPDFYANRLTTSFAQTWTPTDGNGRDGPGTLKAAGKFTATVYYRSGKEGVHEEGKEQHGLVTRGTFGPILSTAMLGVAHSANTEWSRWEEGPAAPMAVFAFQVPQAESHYSISGAGAGSVSGEFGVVGPTAYHGEIGIDPDSGTILRLVMEADPESGSLTERADVMVEYGSVEIGGKTYTCPVHSVSYSVNELFDPSKLPLWKQEAVRLNDVVFSNYHVFRTEMRIVP
jgi:VWFA-related protein